MIFVGYYTIGTPYERESLVLRESLDALGLEHDIVGVPRFATWQQATQHKAKIVRQMLKKYKRRIMYIDVDSIVLSRLDLSFDEMNVDIAAVLFNNEELLSGVVLFNYTPATIDVLNNWDTENTNDPQSWDQRTLHKAIKATPCHFCALHPKYNYIVGLSQRLYPDVQPVILATRGALRYQQEIDRG